MTEPILARLRQWLTAMDRELLDETDITNFAALRVKHIREAADRIEELESAIDDFRKAMVDVELHEELGTVNRSKAGVIEQTHRHKLFGLVVSRIGEGCLCPENPIRPAMSGTPPPDWVDPAPKRLELTVEQIDILTDALYGKPPERDVAHSVQNVLWAARWDDSASGEYDVWCVNVAAFMVASTTPDDPAVIYHDGQAFELTAIENDGVDVTFTHATGQLTMWHGDNVGVVGLWRGA